MSWNYRIFEKTDLFGGNVYYEIHEVYYNSKDQICGITELPVLPFGTDDIEDLRVCFELMTKALERPVLKMEEIEFHDWDNPEEEEL